jgi:isopenicillin N synthase-like dioxygenase
MNTNSFTKIPTLDMKLLSGDSDTEKQLFTETLIETLHTIGFFYLKNHPINPDLMQQVLDLSKIFYSLPQDEKDSISIYNSKHFRGYGKLNAESTNNSPDFKETYDLGLERNPVNDSGKSYQILHGPNQWPPSLGNEFKHTITRYIDEMMKLGMKLMHAIAAGLGIEENIFSESFDFNSRDAYSMLRLLHYPPAQQNAKQFGVGPHVDAGCLIFLLQDDTSGLQVQNNHGSGIDAPPVPDTLIVNIGEMLQLWTNGYFKATPHRVLNNNTNHRYSAPFFFEPNLSASIRPIATFSNYQQHIENGSRPIIYGEHMLQVFQRSFKY